MDELRQQLEQMQQQIQRQQQQLEQQQQQIQILQFQQDATSDIPENIIKPGQILAVAINQSKLIKKYLTPLTTPSSSPGSSPPHSSQVTMSDISLNLEQAGYFYKSTTTRPCIVVDVPTQYHYNAVDQPPTITIVLITSFGGNPLNEVVTNEEFNRVMPIYPTKQESGMPNSIKTNPPWNENPKHKIPSYVLCIPIKVYPQNLRSIDTRIQLDTENLEKLKLHLLALGGIIANADVEDSDEETEEDDDNDIKNFDSHQVYCLEEILV